MSTVRLLGVFIFSALIVGACWWVHIRFEDQKQTANQNERRLLQLPLNGFEVSLHRLAKTPVGHYYALEKPGCPTFYLMSLSDGQADFETTFIIQRKQSAQIQTDAVYVVGGRVQKLRPSAWQSTRQKVSNVVVKYLGQSQLINGPAVMYPDWAALRLPSDCIPIH